MYIDPNSDYSPSTAPLESLSLQCNPSPTTYPIPPSLAPSSPLSSFYPPPTTGDVNLAVKPWIAPPPAPMTFINASIVDPEKGILLKGMTLKIRDGLVHSLKKTSNHDQEDLLKEEKVIDAREWYLCPGLIDCHV